MEKTLFLSIVTLCTLLYLTEGRNANFGRELNAYARAQEEEHEAARVKKHIDLSCRELFESCRGVPKCCGDMQCFFDGGYNYPGQAGECVECVDRSQDCQRDSQCCEPLQCNKDNPWDGNGTCDVKKESGEECYSDGQCVSDDCDKERFWNVHGVCE